ncbi:TlpA family protein disulfide reductase [Myroides sp. M-43]|uniref:TlpA family protein disulfide reductase n=1 Tax=Myroides oncorhynchi TaxID=2893756 RepID=UPI001E61C395|nr:TlpA disulfide reductase family protein [Myroides oncorhynchi]MCC9044198.1 TlpA family protein disulfide reductase [Myroides oncorhynchi]
MNLPNKLIMLKKYVLGCCLLFIIVIVSALCKFTKEEFAKKENNIEKGEGFVTLIFKKFPDQINQGKGLKSNVISFFDEENLQIRDVLVLNFVENDTIFFHVEKEKYFQYYLSNGNDIRINSLYNFQRGDTIIVDFLNGIPDINIRNRVKGNFESNYSINLNIDAPIEPIVFRNRFGRNRTKEESEVYLKERDEYYNKIYKQLDSLKRKNVLSDRSYQLLYYNIYYSQINVDRGGYQFKTIADSHLKQDELLILGSYRFFLENFVQYAYNVKVPEPKVPFVVDYKDAFDKVMNSNDFSTRIKDYLLIYYFKAIISEGSTKEDAIYYFKQLQESLFNKQVLLKLKEEYIILLDGNTYDEEGALLIDAYGNEIKLNDLLKLNNGKIILIDFWASWCGPCLEMMPYSKQLKSDLINYDIVFVYVSIDSNITLWKNVSKKIGLDEVEYNFLAKNYPESKFYRDINLKSIPRYIIYDRKGKIVTLNAPNPNSDSLRKILTKL